MSQALRVGLIGAGGIAPVHVEGIAASASGELVAVADVDPAAGRRASALAGRDLAQHESVASLLADDAIDLVDITLAHHLHAPTALAALQAGKHVLVEKPLALKLEDADALIEAARQAGRRLLVKAYQRSLPLVAALSGELRGALREPSLATAFFVSDRRAAMAAAADWRASWNAAGGGVLFDAGYHLVDVAHALFGDAHTAWGRCWSSAGGPADRTEDTSTIGLEFDGGVVAAISCSWGAAAPMQWDVRVVAAGGVGTLRQTREAGDLRVVAGERGERVVRDADSWRRANVATVAAMVDDVAANRPSVFDAPGARRTLKSILACYRACETGAPVDLATFALGDWRPGPAALEATTR